jgi:hypothetical protein
MMALHAEAAEITNVAAAVEGVGRKYSHEKHGEGTK